MNNTMTNSTFRSAFVSVLLHAVVVVLGSLAIYKTPMATLELSGGKNGGSSITLKDFNFISKSSPKKISTTKNIVPTKEVSPFSKSEAKAKDVVTVAGTNGNSSGVGTGSGTTAASGTGVGNGQDQDHGQLFMQIKNFFEMRLGSTINIREQQLIKIKVILNSEGEILSADLIQGKLDFQILKRLLSVAKTIPLKTFWKSSSAYPQELVIPLVLTPS